MSREQMTYDVIIVGAGPAGLSAAIRLKQANTELSVCVLEKAAEVSGHILSGAVFETRALDELLPDWQTRQAPLEVAVKQDELYFLSARKAWRVPHWLLPKTLQNQGNYIISLGQLCRFLAEQASQLGVEIYPGFAAAEILYGTEGQVIGIITGDMGIAKEGSHKANYTQGMELHGKYTLFAEGCRGFLAEQLMDRYQLRQDACPQTYGLGIKEIWEIDPAKHQPGKVVHTAGWPLDNQTYGGSFIYHLQNNQIAVGFVIGLDYHNPHLDPFGEMQRFKTHPAIKPLFAGGKRLAYGARALNEGGLQALPNLVFPGGLLVGCAAGFLNVAKIKGSHTAMKSAMLAADTIVAAIAKGLSPTLPLSDYPEAIKASWLYQELHQVRNFRPWFRKLGLTLGTLVAGLELTLFKGKVPWTLRHSVSDRDCTRLAAQAPKIDYPKADGVISFDRASSVYLANLHHEEDQPIHLRLKDGAKAIDDSYARYASPEQRYCPAGVYEIVEGPRLQINAANCVHCKTCDIKDPTNNIVWTVPEGGSGPNYSNM